MRASVIGFAILAASCTSFKPVAIHSGDVCDRCRRVITNVALAGEIVDTNGMASRFRTPGCMATYLKEHPERANAIYVTDYATGKMIPARSARFVRIIVDNGTLERDYAAFESAPQAAAFAIARKSESVDWSFVLMSVPDRVASN
jgi:hypothetical protein